MITDTKKLATVRAYIDRVDFDMAFMTYNARLEANVQCDGEIVSDGETGKDVEVMIDDSTLSITIRHTSEGIIIELFEHCTYDLSDEHD